MYTDGVDVTINGFNITSTDTLGSEWIVTEIDGFLDGAASTLQTTQRTWADGTFANQPFYGGRVVTLTGYVRGTNTKNAADSWDMLKLALSLDDQDVVIDWRGYRRLVRARQSSSPLVEFFDPRTLKFNIEVTSSSPWFYSAGGEQTKTALLPSSVGGMSFDYAFADTVQEAPSSWVFPESYTSGSLNITNQGTAPLDYVIKIWGLATNPVITQEGTDYKLGLSTTVNSNEFVSFNSRTHDILLNGVTPSQGIISSREWFTLNAGVNTLHFSADSGDNTAHIEITYIEAWL